ncbi:hypothetical protein PG984_014093 [Apiospora sp. TS-2023a]
MESQLVLSTPATEGDTFHPFLRLPIELRIKIWELLIPETKGRLVWVREPGWVMMERAKFPSILLSACHESRCIYLQRFPMGLEVSKRALHTDYWGHSWHANFSWYDKGLVYLNPDHDVLMLGQPWEQSDPRQFTSWVTTFTGDYYDPHI